MLGNEQVRFGGRPSEKGQFMAPRWRPTLPHGGFGERHGETGQGQPRNRAPHAYSAVSKIF
jgi:hypothetical protein